MELKVKIAEGLAACGPKVVDRVVETMVERETNKRSTALVTVLDLLAREELDLKKIDRPDTEAYDGEGKVVSSTYTKGRIEEIKKAKESIAKKQKAISDALEKNDYSGVYNYAK